MTQEYIPTIYQEGDEERIVPLLKIAFNGWPFFDIECSAVDHWKWRYLDNPEHQGLVVKINDGNKIVAVGHNIMYKILINGVEYVGAYGTDHCVLPDYQGMGLSKKITRAQHQLRIDNSISFGYIITNNPKIINSSAVKKAMPYPFPHRVNYLTRIEDIEKHLKETDSENGYIRRIGHKIDRLRSKSISQLETEAIIKVTKGFDERVDYFIREVNQSYDFILMRSRDYLNWRYCDLRAGEYHVVYAEEGEDIVGYAVYRINKLKDYHQGFIVDLLALPDRIDVAEGLVVDALGFFEKNNVNSVSSQAIEGHPYDLLFKQYGFHGGEGSRKILYNNLLGDELLLGDIAPERAYFSFGDLTGI